MKTVAYALVIGSLALAAPAAAHHSYAMFDRDKDLALAGAVKEWRWTNPHTFMVLIVPKAGGPDAEWRIEGQSTEVLRLKGWNRDMVKVGDKVTVHIKPLKNGTNGGQLAGVTAADGQVYK